MIGVELRHRGLYAGRVQQAIGGFVTIWAVMAVGWFLAHRDIARAEHQQFLSTFTFLVANPCLLFTLVARADLGHLFSRTLLVSIIAISCSLLLYLTYAVLRHQSPANAVIAGLCSCYTNVGNLGMPIASFVLGDMTWVAPIMLLQLGILQPTALAVLDMCRARDGGQPLRWLTYLSLPIRNPMTVGTLAGLVFNLMDWQLPTMVLAPVQLVANSAVPMMLLAFGISLRLDPLPGKGPHLEELVLVNVLKVVVQPIIGYLVGTFVFGLTVPEVLAVCVLAGLPTAQNVFIISARYNVHTQLARDAIFWSTILCVPTIITMSTLLR